MMLFEEILKAYDKRNTTKSDSENITRIANAFDVSDSEVRNLIIQFRPVTED